MQLGIAAYVVPFVFVYQPGLIFDGSAADIAIVNAVSDDPTVQAAIGDIVDAVLP